MTKNKIFASSNNDKSGQNINETQARFVGLTLSGPNLESWSTVISISISERGLQEKLSNFKDRIRLKKHSIGLITGPVFINESREFMDLITKKFPEIRFLGTFSNDDDLYFGINPITEEGKIYKKISFLVV